ncbi:M48 family metallopeptidase [Thermodesulfobacteriota bacterium]
MMKLRSQICHIEGVGPVLFEHSLRARRLILSVRAYNGIRVAVPRNMSFSHALRAIVPKIGWMRDHLEKIRQSERIHDTLPRKSTTLSPQKAREQLKNRIDSLAREHGFSYNRLFVRQQKTLWGSCSAKNNISLNVKLLNLPEKLMDFVILHELVHTRIKHHGQEFKDDLERIIPEARDLHTQLKKYRIPFL